MLKFGIWEAAQDVPAQRLWRRGLTAASLLAMSDPPSASDKERFERLMPRICLANGVARTTVRRRFSALNDKIQRCLLDIFPPDFPLVAEDWAASSGVTAAEWFQCLRSDYPQVQFTASDAALYLIEARCGHGKDAYILEPDGVPVQYVRPPFVVSLAQEQHWFYAVNRCIQKQGALKWFSLADRLHIPEWDDTQGCDTPVNAPPFVLRRLPLVHPEVMALCGETFHIRQHSVFAPLGTPVDVIRTMNILNLGYFPEAQLRKAVAAVKKSLQPGGVWVVGRTLTENPPQHEVTVFRNRPAGWQVLLRVGQGSEMEPLVSLA